MKSADGKIGTTGRGIGPCYEDKMARIGVRAGDLKDKELVRRKIETALIEKTPFLKIYIILKKWIRTRFIRKLWR